jgi:Tfp pilus assembly protein PilZ
MKQVSRGNRKRRVERRTTPRVGVQIWVEETAGQGLYFHRVTNLSLGGFFIEKKLPFPIGQKVSLRLELPDSGQEFSLTGKIINNYQDKDDNLKGAGIQFIDLDEQVRAGIAAYLKRVAGSRQAD